MEQEKIGKFISYLRKEKNLTQSELAEKLGVSDRSVGNWERGRNMPDLSLFKPLCEILDISINELLSGERIKEEKYQEKLEENIINTINYGNKKVKEKNKIISLILIVFGVLISVSAMTIFPSESSWGSIYGVIGCIISLIGISKITKKFNYIKRLVIHAGYFILYFCFLIIIDFISVITIKQPPRFSIFKESYDNMIIYRAFFYNVFRINVDDINEYYIIDTKNKYTKDSVPISPFNRNKVGIDNIIKYKSSDLNDNQNMINLINDLPLSEYNSEIIINKENNKLLINYSITDRNLFDNFYLEKSLVYNTISIFTLLDNIDSISYSFKLNIYSSQFTDIDFSNMHYEVTRKRLKDNFNMFNVLASKTINKDVFNEYVEKRMNDDGYTNYLFSQLFVIPKLFQTVKIEVQNCNDEFIKNITSKEEIEELIGIISEANKLPNDAVVDLISHSWKLIMYNKAHEKIATYLVWYGGSFADERYRYTLGYDNINKLKNILE